VSVAMTTDASSFAFHSLPPSQSPTRRSRNRKPPLKSQSNRSAVRLRSKKQRQHLASRRTSLALIARRRSQRRRVLGGLLGWVGAVQAPGDVQAFGWAGAVSSEPEWMRVRVSLRVDITRTICVGEGCARAGQRVALGGAIDRSLAWVRGWVCWGEGWVPRRCAEGWGWVRCGAGRRQVQVQAGG
jgi:hypothetical protein